MSWGEIVGAVIGGMMLIFVVLSWAGIVPKRVTESAPVKRLLGINTISLIAVALVGTLIYLAVAEKEIPSTLTVITVMVIIYLYWSR